MITDTTIDARPWGVSEGASEAGSRSDGVSQGDVRDAVATQLADQGYGLPPLLTVAETAQFLRIGKSRLYESLRADPAFKGLYVRFGRSYRVRRDALLALVEGGGRDA